MFKVNSRKAIGKSLDSVASDPWNSWKPWKTPEMVDTPEKVPKLPWKMKWSLEKYEKKPAKIGV